MGQLGSNSKFYSFLHQLFGLEILTGSVLGGDGGLKRIRDKIGASE